MLYVHEFGPADGAPLLALHGVSGHGGRFADLAERLGNVRIIAPDLRGHGRSPSLPPWDLDRQVDDIVDVLDQRGLGMVPAVGHSAGAVLAVRLAYRGRVERLALLDPGTLSSKQPDLALANAERMRIDVSYADRAEARADRVRNGWADIAPGLVEAELDDHLVRTDDGRWSWRYNRSALVALFGELTRPVPAPPAGIPALLVIGTRSTAVTPEYRRACATGEVVEIDCGHLVYYERPVIVAEHIAAFLA